MKDRLENITIRLEPETRVGLARAAEEDRRPVGNLVRNILSDWVESRSSGGQSEQAA